MIATIKAEYRKLMSVRSTYIVSCLALLAGALLAGYAFGYRSSEQPGDSFISQAILAVINLTSLFAAIICVLQVTHEYRHNTILYTLTASNSRLKVFLAKVLVLTGYLVVFMLASAVLTAVATYIGASLAGSPIAGQQITWWSITWRSFASVWLYGMIAFSLAMLCRSVAAALAILLVAPSTLEPLLGLVLKDKAIYLPFTALQQLVSSNPQLTYIKALWVSAIYVGVLLVAAWVLFWRRDAN